MAYSSHPFLNHFSEESDIFIKKEKDELIPETCVETLPCPEPGPSREQFFIQLNMTKNTTGPMEGSLIQEFHNPVKIEKELMKEAYDEASYSYIPGAGLVKDESVNLPSDLTKRSTAQQEEPDYSVEIEKEEFTEEAYGEEPRPYPEFGPSKKEYSINPLDFSKNGTGQMKEAPGMNWDCSSSKLKGQNVPILIRKEKMPRMLLNDKHLLTGEKLFACDFCNATFKQRGNLVRHIRTHTGERPFGCDLCSARFTQKGSLVDHIRTHTGEKPFGCDSCPARFTLKGHLVDHIRTHTGEKPFECDICSARFAQKGILVNHIRTHTGEKSFVCDFCSARFTRKESLVKHLRTHTGEKPFACELCSTRFTEKGSLVKHIRIHTGEKPFECDSCSARFTIKEYLVNHIRTHTGEKPYRCDFCSASFTQKKSLSNHIRSHNDESLRSPILVQID